MIEIVIPIEMRKINLDDKSEKDGVFHSWIQWCFGVLCFIADILPVGGFLISCKPDPESWMTLWGRSGISL